MTHQITTSGNNICFTFVLNCVYCFIKIPNYNCLVGDASLRTTHVPTVDKRPSCAFDVLLENNDDRQQIRLTAYFAHFFIIFHYSALQRMLSKRQLLSFIFTRSCS